LSYIIKPCVNTARWRGKLLAFQQQHATMNLMIAFQWLWFLIKALWWLLCKLADGLAWTLRLAATDFRTLGALGTARWATRSELFWAGVHRGTGPIIGRSRTGKLMRFTRDGTVQVFGAMGSGKGIGVVIPTLLDYPGSIVVTDVKGENYAITARHRAERGNRVVKFDPSDLAHSARFNPMDMLRLGSFDEQDDARALANLMVIPEGEAHWSDKSVSLLSALILHALHDANPDNRSLGHVRKLSVGEPAVLQARIREIAYESPSPLAQTIAQGFLGSASDGDKPFPEFASILSTLQKATEPFAEGTPGGILTAQTTFHLEELTGKQPVTAYFCVEEEKLTSYARWLRVMTGCTLNALMRAKRTGRPKHKVVLLLDEVFVLGRLDPLEKNAGLLRAYCTPVLIWQSVPQARSVYGKAADAFVANASCRVYLGTTDNETATQVSTLCGQTPVRTRSQGTSQQSDAWVRENRSQGESDGGYWLIDPSEVQRLPLNRVVIKLVHVPFPILAWRANYLTRWRWKFRYDRWDPSAPAPLQAQAPARPSGPVYVRPLAPSLAPGAPVSSPPPAARQASPPTTAARP
jgi:type IV secretion system protein VirD4